MNILTKDISVFVTGSWMFPYLVMVPLNTIISGTMLYLMFGPVVIVCYVGMFALLAI